MLRIILLSIASLFVLGLIIASIRRKNRHKANKLILAEQDPKVGDLSSKNITITDPEISLDHYHFEDKDDIHSAHNLAEEAYFDKENNDYICQDEPLGMDQQYVQKKENIESESFRQEFNNFSYSQNNSTPLNSNQNYDDLVVFYIMAPTGKKFIGYELLQAIAATGMQHGAKGMFHYYDKISYQSDNEAKMGTMFSLAALSDTGEIDIDSLGDFVTHGLCLFLNIRYRNPLFAYKCMLKVLQQLVDDLEGKVFDIEYKPCSQNYLEVCHNKIMRKLNAKPYNFAYAG